MTIWFEPPQGGDITFRECVTHRGLLYAGEHCPVCLAHALLRDKEMRIAKLEGFIEELKQQMDGG